MLLESIIYVYIYDDDDDDDHHHHHDNEGLAWGLLLIGIGLSSCPQGSQKSGTHGGTPYGGGLRNPMIFGSYTTSS